MDLEVFRKKINHPRQLWDFCTKVATYIYILTQIKGCLCTIFGSWAFKILCLGTFARGLRRAGLTPAFGSAHTRSGRECREIEPIRAAVLRRGARRIFHGWVKLGRETTKKPYTLHPYNLSLKF